MIVNKVMPEWMKTAGIGVNYDVDSMEMQLCSHSFTSHRGEHMSTIWIIYLHMSPKKNTFTVALYTKYHLSAKWSLRFLLFHHPVRAGKRERRAQATGYIPKSSPPRHASGIYHT